MVDGKDFKQVGFIINKDSNGSFESVGESISRKEFTEKPVFSIKNTSTKKQHVQMIGKHTDVLMAPGAVLPMTMQDDMMGVPEEMKGTGVKKIPYKPEHEPSDILGGVPGMKTTNARDFLPDDHQALRKARGFEQRLGAPLAGMGSEAEVQQILERASDLAAMEAG